MAASLTSSLSTQTPSHIWKVYHQAQLQAFQACFPKQTFGKWNCYRLRKEAERACPRLTVSTKLAVQGHLQVAIENRERMSQLYPYDSDAATIGHTKFVELLKDMLRLVGQNTEEEQRRELHADPKTNDECFQTVDLAGRGADPLESEDSAAAAVSGVGSQPEEVDATDSLNQDLARSFLQMLAASVEDICQSWGAVRTENRSLSTATAYAIWSFRTLSADLASTWVTCPEIINLLLDGSLSALPFLEELHSAKNTNTCVVTEEKTTYSGYLNNVLVHSMRRPNGFIPIVHDLARLLGSVDTVRTDYGYMVVQASVCTVILLRMRGQWDSWEVSNQNQILMRQLCTLESLTEDPTTIRSIRTAAQDSPNIVTTGSLSLFVEANIQKQLHNMIGTPLFTTTIHLYNYLRLRAPPLEMDPTMERLCEDFAPLLFWLRKPPLTCAVCKESLKNWVMGARFNSHLLPDFFDNRMQLPLSIPLVERLFGAESLQKGRGDRLRKYSRESMLTELESTRAKYSRACTVFQATKQTLQAQNRVGTISSAAGNGMALELCAQILRDDFSGQTLPDMIFRMRHLATRSSFT